LFELSRGVTGGSRKSIVIERFRNSIKAKKRLHNVQVRNHRLRATFRSSRNMRRFLAGSLRIGDVSVDARNQPKPNGGDRYAA
jgi:hypothetical protein